MTNANDQQIAAMFKPVDGGYVFRQPLTIWNARRFLVTEAQKAELVALLVPKRPILKGVIFATVLIVIAVAAALLVAAFSPHPNPTAVDLVVMVAAIFVAMAAAFLVFRSWQQRRLAPLLARLTPTDLPFTLQEAKIAAANVMSIRQMTFVLACTVLAAVTTTGSGIFAITHRQTIGYLQLTSGIVFIALTVYWTKRLIDRRRLEATRG